MKRLILTVLVAAIAGGWMWDDAHAASRTVYVVDRSTVVNTAELANALPAFQAAVTEDFAPVWGQDAQLVLTAAAPADGWTIFVDDDTDAIFAEGYHWFNGQRPYARTFAHTAMLFDDSWQAVFTHELFEMLADPYVDRLALGKRLWLVEVADPVEGGRFNYARPAADGSLVPISDFVFPNWYRKRGPKDRMYDFGGYVDRPGQLLEDGYASYWQRGRWKQVFREGG